MTEPDIGYDDAAAIGFKVAEMAERLRVAHAVCPGAHAKWFFEADDIRYRVIVTIEDGTSADPRPASSTEDTRQGSVLQQLIEEYEGSGHKTVVRHGRVFAQVLDLDTGQVLGCSDIDLTRLAAAIDRRLP